MADSEEWHDQAEERFAANLRAAREHAGLSQQALARQMRDLGYRHVRQQTIAQIEGGSRSVRLGEALALSRLTGTRIDSLVRPQGLNRDASRLLDAARRARKAFEALTDSAARLRTARESLWHWIALAAREGKTESLADELHIARRAAAADVLSVARVLAAELLYDAEAHPGRTLGAEDRATAMAVAAMLGDLAEDVSPVESLQEKTWHLVQRYAGEKAALLQARQELWAGRDDKEAED